MRRTSIGWIAAVLTLGATTLAPAPTTHAAGANIVRIRLGNSFDVEPARFGPSMFLQGNGSPNTEAFQAHVQGVSDGPLDVVVLAASLPSGGSQTPECDLVIVLDDVNSCETITIKKATAANDAGATAAVADAEIVYFAGGNQCNYVGWKGSTVHAAVQGVVASGGGVGGGSAGLAIQGEFVYDGCKGSVLSSEALANPYHRFITFTYGLFAWTELADVITDSHFVTSNRMGRLMAFLCRQIKDGKTGAAWGIGIDDASALVVDADGAATLYGTVAYVVLADHQPEQCAARKPLTYSGYKIWRIDAGGTFDLRNRPTAGYYLRSVTNGVVSADPYTP